LFGKLGHRRVAGGKPRPWRDEVRNFDGTDSMTTTSQLKMLLARRAAVTVPGAPNALFARVIEDLGFEAVYVTGAGVANMHLGVPDVGLTTMTEVAETLAAIADAVSLPIIVDADTGFGNAVNTVRTVRTLERAGAAGIQIEDQIFPKKCGHFGGKNVISPEEMVQKIKAAVDTRHDQDLQIIARTDTRAVEGFERAIERALAYMDAGADATFVEAPVSLEELARIPKELSVPQFANIVFGGKTPDPGRERLADLGFSVVLYANAVLQAALKASYEVLGALKAEGSLQSVAHRLASFEERQNAVAKDEWDAREARYRV
jgi:2-methylisocitrate lyase-like PEP mutase family enzyme